MRHESVGRVPVSVPLYGTRFFSVCICGLIFPSGEEFTAHLQRMRELGDA